MPTNPTQSPKTRPDTRIESVPCVPPDSSIRQTLSARRALLTPSIIYYRSQQVFLCSTVFKFLSRQAWVHLIPETSKYLKVKLLLILKPLVIRCAGGAQWLRWPPPAPPTQPHPPHTSCCNPCQCHNYKCLTSQALKTLIQDIVCRLIFTELLVWLSLNNSGIRGMGTEWDLG